MSAGYEFVPLPARVRRVRRPEAVHDRRVPGTLSAVLSLTFVTEQQVHVGAGSKELVDDDVVRQGLLIHGRPGVPGASMKGVLRARYEAITRSCVTLKPSRGQVRVRSSSGIQSARLDDRLLDGDVFRAKEEAADGDLCPACALFGRMSLRSRVTLTDFAIKGDALFEVAEIPEQFSPNLHHVGRGSRRPSSEREHDRGAHFEVHELHGRKFAVGRGPVADKARWQKIEVFPKGSALQGTMRVHNALPRELGGLLVALGWKRESALKIGGGKGQGFGRIRLQHLVAHLRDPAGRAVELEDAWITMFERSEDCHAEGMARLVEIHQGDC
ncbi:RAMP superfamily CRISPR-associated protein [Sorangium sp. So ce426]|uniref:RAMP superfamily CRISPR-associated protein n=1 Tax=Sorangium sp. So ce426 TaxID=3133312 RepID=UPI003F5BE0CE